jgi:L-ascorbate metabolism protein UlaG (beta-lactamase superfamily)
MRKAYCSESSFLNSIYKHKNDKKHFNVWWLGQSGFLIQWNGKHLLMDPYLSESLTNKYAETDKPHIRMTERVVNPLKMDFVNVVTASHGHTDHLDPETLHPLIKANNNLDLIVPAAEINLAMERSGLPKDKITTINVGETIKSNGFTIRAIPSAHEKIKKDQDGNHFYLGYIVNFGSWTIYHSGDTIEYDQMEKYLSAWDLDIVFLPINGRKQERRVPGNMWGNESASLAKRVNARAVIPHHYNMFTFNTESPKNFIAEANNLGQLFFILENGQRWSSKELE